MELGILSLSDLQKDPETGQPVPALRRIDEIVGYAVLADTLGLDVFGLGEHHGLDFAVSSPAVVLAAIAARTRTLRMTSAVTVLSTLDPVRVYQDFATLDLLSHGRAEVIAGRSAFLEPFSLFGVALEDYDAVFVEKLDLLLKLRERTHISWAGRFRSPLDHAAVAPRARQDLLPIWAGLGGSPASAERAGRLGLPMVLGYIGGSLEQAEQTVKIYRAAGEWAGHPPERLRVGLSTHFFAGSSPEAARRVRPHYQEYLRPKTPSGRGFLVTAEQFEAGTERAGAIMIGSSEELIQKIMDAHQVLGVDRFFGQIDWGGLPRLMVEESIHRFATEIAPAVRAATAASRPVVS